MSNQRFGDLGDHDDNTHRSLPELVSVNAWFKQDNEKPSCFTLHADVSFSETRLGGGPDTNITFKLAVKKCDIVFVLPATAPFRVDPSSVRTPRPLNPRSVYQKDSSKTHASARAKLSLDSTGLSGGGSAEAGHEMQREKTAESAQTESHYHELWKRVRGNHAWSVDGRDLNNKRLAGPVFNPHEEPRLTIIDERNDEGRIKDEATNMNPVASVQVRCLREDIDIFEITYKDSEKQSWFERSAFSKNKLAAAREVLKQAIVREGLVAGDLSNDPYAEVMICDVSITIVDRGA
ncbi:MAG: hypothetical protein ACEPO2_03110 [Pelagibaca sp.]